MNNYIKELYVAGVSRQIYAAIDTNDMVEAVCAASRGLQRVKFPKPVAKSIDESASFRIEGNKCYRAGMHRQAVQCYNQALVHALKHSKEMILAYSNRSAVFFTIRYFTACLQDINTCFSMACSEELTNRLKKRRQDALLLTHEEIWIEIKTNSILVNKYFQFDCKRNRDVPCASADVAFVSRNGVKRATARGNIKPGTLMALERAFMTSQMNERGSKYLSCYYCNRTNLCLHPCEGCCQAMFCGNECRNLCMKEYHRIECQIVDNIALLYGDQIKALTTKTAIKLSLKMPWDKFITASKDIGASSMKTATVRQTFNSEEPLSILSYEPNEQFMEGKFFNGSIFCAYNLQLLNNITDKDYLPEEVPKRVEALNAMARVMLHLYVTFNKKIHIVSSGCDLNNKAFIVSIQNHIGWFSMTSKLQHSCEPNLLVRGLNDSVALVALRTIKIGEELTISYNDIFYDSKLSNPDKNPLRRATDLFLQTGIMCYCRVCQHNWDRDSAVNVKLTNKQFTLIAKLESDLNFMSQEYFHKLCAALDAFPVNSIPHKWVYDNLRKMLILPECKFSRNVSYL